MAGMLEDLERKLHHRTPAPPAHKPFTGAATSWTTALAVASSKARTTGRRHRVVHLRNFDPTLLPYCGGAVWWVVELDAPCS